MIALGLWSSQPCSLEKTVKLSAIRAQRGIVSAGLLSAALLLGSAQAKVVEYDLTIDTLGTTIAGATIDSLAIDGQIPAPTLRATLGDTLRVTFRNRLKVPASIHWHGLLLPGDQDGVPYLNTAPILPEQSFTYDFPIIQAGTFWYHSHTDLQIQRGVYGSIVLAEPAAHDAHGGHEIALQEEVILFSDWTNESPTRVLENLKKDDDYYAFKKNNVQSWDKVIAGGQPTLQARFNQSLTRMGPMDLADVAYDAFLANGEEIAQIDVKSQSASEMKLRLINGSTSSYFDVEYAGGLMRIVAADGQPVAPLDVKRLRMATAETYDVIVPLAEGKAFELRATSFDGSGYSSTFIGEGERVAAPTIPRPNLLLQGHAMHSAGDSPIGHSIEHPTDHSTDHSMDHSTGHSKNHAVNVPAASSDHSAHQMPATRVAHSQHDSHAPQAAQHGSAAAMVKTVDHLTSYESLVSLVDTTLPIDRPTRVVALELTGNMQRYVWSFNGLTQREDPRLSVEAGDNVRLELSNSTMMHHPIHLHGHFFRVINGQGERSPLKHTVDVPPMGRVVIEFAASEDQDWLFHCHNQYHMKSGMNRVISYVDSSQFDAAMAQSILPMRRWYSRNSLRAQRNVLGIDYSVMDERHSFLVEADHALDSARDNFELRTSYSYQLSRFTAPFVSMERRRHEDGEQDTRVFAGLRMTLPLFIDSEIGIDDAGDARLELGSGLQLTRRFALDWRWNTDEEYRLGVGFNLSKRTAIVFGKDSDFGTGFGVSYLF